jgi:hypothetical protein
LINWHGKVTAMLVGLLTSQMLPIYAQTPHVSTQWQRNIATCDYSNRALQQGATRNGFK